MLLPAKPHVIIAWLKDVMIINSVPKQFRNIAYLRYVNMKVHKSSQ